MRLTRLLGGLGAAFLYFTAETSAGGSGIVTNLWTKSEGGKWEETAAWSAGQMPGALQWAGILNAGEKTVEIDAATAQNNPQSLLISHLVVSNANTLLLNNVGVSLQIN